MPNNSIIVPKLFDPLLHDPYWGQVATLLRFNGPQNNRTFSDYKGRPVNNAGSVVYADLAKPVVGPVAGVFPNPSGSQQMLEITQLDDNVGGDFTIEFYAMWDAITNCTMFDTRPGGNGQYIDFFYYTGSFGIYMNSTTVASVGWSIQTGKVYHIALSHKAGVTRCFVNGALAFTYNNAGGYKIPTLRMGTNGLNNTIDHFQGRMSEIRYTKGVGRYVAPFTPDFVPFPTAA